MSSTRDRETPNYELTKTPWPLPPLNLFMLDGSRGQIDLRWDNPAILAGNSGFRLLGVNVYRSFDSEYGPYHRLTELPVGATFWRDQTDNELVVGEDVSNSFQIRGRASSGSDVERYVFRTASPIVSEASQGAFSFDPQDVRVYVDGVEAKVRSILGSTGEVEIDANLYPDTATQTYFPRVLPGPTSVVTCTYRKSRSVLRTDLRQRVFYRVTTVGIPVSCSWGSVTSTELVETPLERAAATSRFEIEKLDFIWREAIRRNRFILEQGGERVQAFIRKSVGVSCTCYDDERKQPRNNCMVCYGVGILGGYEGPYDILVAPDDSEVRVVQTERGRNREHTYEVWTGPQPLLSQRDFILKLNGDRYSIGPVRMPSNRGNVMQQHFSIGAIDEQDIRYKVPVGTGLKYPAVQFVPTGPSVDARHDLDEKRNIPDERELKGRTPVWRNGMY